MCCIPDFFFFLIGYIVVWFSILFVLYQSCKLLYAWYIAPSLGLGMDFRRMGPWSVVTGCTAGIGLEYTRQLAEKGQNIVLISRSLEKLNMLKDEIEKKYKVQTKVIVADFSHGSSIYAGIKEQLDGLEIGTLVNNVGMSHFPGRFGNIPEENIIEVLNVNVLSTMMMSKMILPQMSERKRGVVINISSVAEAGSFQGMILYCATKAFISMLSSGLQLEYYGDGILVQNIAPGPVDTPLLRKGMDLIPAAKRADLEKILSKFIVSAESYVRAALPLVGIMNNSYVIWKHGIQYAMQWTIERLPLPLRVAYHKKMMLFEDKKNE